MDIAWPETQTSLLRQIAGSNDHVRAVALGIMFERYRRSLARVIAGKFGFDSFRCEELLLDFVSDKLLDGQFVAKYLESLENTGKRELKFRGYISRSVYNYTIEQLRKEKDFAPVEDHEAEVIDDIEKLLEAEKCTEILSLAFRGARDYYLRENPNAWNLYLKRHIEPTIFDRKAASYDELAPSYGYRDAKHAASAVLNVNRSINRRWKELTAKEPEFQGTAWTSLQRVGKFMNFRQLFLSMLVDEDTEASEWRLASDQIGHILTIVCEHFEGLPDLEKAIVCESTLSECLSDIFEPSSMPEVLRTKNVIQILENDQDYSVLLELYKLLEEHAQKSECEMPLQIALALRLTLIARARNQFSKEIASLSEATLEKGIDEVLSYPWLDGRLVKELEQVRNSRK